MIGECECSVHRVFINSLVLFTDQPHRTGGIFCFGFFFLKTKFERSNWFGGKILMAKWLNAQLYIEWIAIYDETAFCMEKLSVFRGFEGEVWILYLINKKIENSILILYKKLLHFNEYRFFFLFKKEWSSDSYTYRMEQATWNWWCGFKNPILWTLWCYCT